MSYMLMLSPIAGTSALATCLLLALCLAASHALVADGKGLDRAIAALWFGAEKGEMVSLIVAQWRDAGSRAGCRWCALLDVLVEKDHCAKQLDPNSPPTPTLNAIRAGVCLVLLALLLWAAPLVAWVLLQKAWNLIALRPDLAAAIGCVLLCAVGFRIRGGLLAGTRVQTPGQVSRLIFAAAVGLTAWTAMPWTIALATVPLWWIASTLPLFDAIGLGTVHGIATGRFWRDFGMLAVRGLLWTLLPALALWWPWGLGAPHWWALLLAGPLMPVAYWAGRQSGCRWPGLGARDWVQTSEAIYGAVLGAGVLAAVH